jgi:transcriptional regulator with XRE-family HTH domain
MPAVLLATGRFAACRTLGSDEQIFGDDEQVLHKGEATKKENQVRSQQQRPSNMNRAKGLDEADVSLGRRLRSLRVRRGLSQTALGDVLGVSFQQIQRYETGTHRIKVSQLQRLAAALAVSMTELLEAPRTNSSEITDMIDTPIARRLMDAFQRLTSRERRCLAALAEEMAVRR